jgi:hypothetical protein
VDIAEPKNVVSRDHFAAVSATPSVTTTTTKEHKKNTQDHPSY